MRTFKVMAALAAALAVAAAGAGPAAAAGGQESIDEAAFLAIVTPELPTTIQAHFTVPTVNCTSTPGIEDATAQVLALSGELTARSGSGVRARGGSSVAGGLAVRADVRGTCAGTSAVYQARAMGAPLAMTVQPGDKMLLTASFDPSTQQSKATVDDLTTGVTRTRASTGTGPQFAPFSAFAGVQRVRRDPVPDFGVIHWSHVRINGAPIGTAQSLFGFDLISSIAHPRVLIRTAPLSKAGDAFTNTWVAGH